MNKLTLVTLPAAFGMRNVSPFCLKIEMLLTDLELPFEQREEPDPRKAPKGKMPYLIDGDRKIADSELITEYLDRLTEGKVYSGLSAEQKAVGVAASRLVEDHLYWLMVASRWLDDEWWPNIVRDFFGFIPGFIRPFAAGSARRSVAKTYDLHGLGRHSLEEQKGFAERDLAALESLVSQTQFLGGDSPRIHDFTVAGMTAGIYDNQPATWVTEIAQRYEGVRDHAERVQKAVGVYGRELAAA